MTTVRYYECGHPQPTNKESWSPNCELCKGFVSCEDCFTHASCADYGCAYEQAMREAGNSARVPWTDDGIPMLRVVVVQAEASLTNEQREALTSKMTAMTTEDWDDFATAMIRPVQPEDLIAEDS